MSRYALSGSICRSLALPPRVCVQIEWFDVSTQLQIHHLHELETCRSVLSFLFSFFPIYSQLTLFIFTFALSFSHFISHPNDFSVWFPIEYFVIWCAFQFLCVSLSLIYSVRSFVVFVSFKLLQPSSIFISLLNFQLTNMSLQLCPIIFNPQIIYGDKLNLVHICSHSLCLSIFASLLSRSLCSSAIYASVCVCVLFACFFVGYWKRHSFCALKPNLKLVIRIGISCDTNRMRHS